MLLELRMKGLVGIDQNSLVAASLLGHADDVVSRLKACPLSYPRDLCPTLSGGLDLPEAHQLYDVPLNAFREAIIWSRSQTDDVNITPKPQNPMGWLCM